MNTDTLKKILTEKSVSFTEEELKKIIDDELEKSEEEMDVELIDRCLDLIDSSTNSKLNDKRKRGLKVNKLFLIAAIVILFLCIAVPVGAKFLSIDAAENVVKYYDDYFRVDMSDENLNDTNEAVIKTNAQKVGINDVALPSDLLSDDYSVDNFNVDENNEISFTISNSNINCYVIINYYRNIDDYENIAGKFIVPNEAEIFKQLEVDTVDILVCNAEEISTIYYSVGNCEYKLILNSCEFNFALDLANTIDYV